jgi:hypothetical protein
VACSICRVFPRFSTFSQAHFRSVTGGKILPACRARALRLPGQEARPTSPHPKILPACRVRVLRLAGQEARSTYPPPEDPPPLAGREFSGWLAKKRGPPTHHPKILACRARVLRLAARSEVHLPTTRRSSPLAGRAFSGWLAKRGAGVETAGTWPVSLTISPASGEDSGRWRLENRGPGGSWPANLTISPASGEDFQAVFNVIARCPKTTPDPVAYRPTKSDTDCFASPYHSNSSKPLGGIRD